MLAESQGQGCKTITGDSLTTNERTSQGSRRFLEHKGFAHVHKRQFQCLPKKLDGVKLEPDRSFIIVQGEEAKIHNFINILQLRFPPTEFL